MPTIHNSDLYELFETLDEQELRDLRRFLLSPYFNQREDVLRLFEYLRECQKKKKQAFWLDKETVYRAVYSEAKSLDEKQLNLVLYQLSAAIRHYWSIQKAEGMHFGTQLQLLQTLRKKRLKTLFVKELEKTYKELDAQPYRNAAYHAQLAMLHNEYYEWYAYQQRESDVRLQELSEEWAYFTILTTLRQACLMHSHQAVVRREYDFKLVKEVLAHIEQHDYQGQPAILLYYHSYKALTATIEEGHTHFDASKQLLKAHGHLFPSSELRNMTINAINYCMKRVQSDFKLRSEALDLYKFALERAVLLENDVLPAYTYKNITTAALGIGDAAWARQFIEQYKTKLPEATQTTFYHYALAYYFFKTKDYKNAEKYLKNSNFDDILVQFDAERILAMLYFELESWDELDHTLRRFQSNLEKNQKSAQKVNNTHFDLQHNFIQHLKTLAQSDLKNTKTNQTLRQSIENERFVAEREWLLTAVG